MVHISWDSISTSRIRGGGIRPPLNSQPVGLTPAVCIPFHSDNSSRHNPNPLHLPPPPPNPASRWPSYQPSLPLAACRNRNQISWSCRLWSPLYGGPPDSPCNSGQESCWHWYKHSQWAPGNTSLILPTQDYPQPPSIWIMGGSGWGLLGGGGC